MPTEFFKPDRHKKYHNKKALILKTDKYQSQNAFRKRKSVLYQNIRFQMFGSEFSLINLLIALDETVKEFTDRYGDNLHPRHGLLLILIKHYVTDTNAISFKPAEIFEYYPHLNGMFGSNAKDVNRFQGLFNDLAYLHFVNPQGHAYIPSTRMKVFNTMFEQHAKGLFKEPEN